MNLPVFVLGAGGHSKVAIEALLASSVRVHGILDPDRQKKGMIILGVSVIGAEDELLKYKKESILLVNGLGSIRKTKQRNTLYLRFKKDGYRFARVIHPAAVIASDVKVEEGAHVMAGAVIQPGSVIGENAIVNTNASVDHDCQIGSHVFLAPGVTLSGGVHVGEGTHIGTGAIIIQGLQIGRNALIGAGTLVVKDVPDGVTIIGLPGRVAQT